MREQTIELAIKASGGITAVADALQESKQTVHNWSKRECVPADRCVDFERVTGLMRWHLRPVDWHRIWPELIGTKGSPKVPAKAVA